MSIPDQDSLIARATALVRKHFDSLNRGELAHAKEQLFWPPGISDEPVDVYLQTMQNLAPFKIISLVVRNYDGVRRKRHGTVATIWINVTVMCELGRRSGDITVWWFPESDRWLISSRPTEWVLEKLKTTQADQE